jgi:glucose-6-phosphate 1-epimerase
MDFPGTLAELNHRFRIPGIAQVVEGNGGLAKVQVTSAEASGEIYLHGAHVTSWFPRAAEEVLFVSSQSQWKAGHSIRGGVPICFPWFANKTNDRGAPAHGFVRTKAWQLESIVRDADAVTVTLCTKNDDSTKQWWPFDFHLCYRATFGSELNLELELTNTGTRSFHFEEALHTYLRVGDIGKARLHGLNTVHYVDKTDANCKKAQAGPLVISSETDRIYLNTSQAVEIEDQVLRRRLRLAKENSLTTVVWNPWAQKARELPDLGDAEWRQMVCVETCNVSDFAIEVAPGRQHRMKAILTVADS